MLLNVKEPSGLIDTDRHASIRFDQYGCAANYCDGNYCYGDVLLQQRVESASFE